MSWWLLLMHNIKRKTKMEIWNLFTDFIVQSITFFTQDVGVSQAVAIILFTVIGRLVLMPINLVAMANMVRNKKAIAALKPELDSIKNNYKDQPSKIAKLTMALYKKHNIKFIDKKMCLIWQAKAYLALGLFRLCNKLYLLVSLPGLPVLQSLILRFRY